MLSCLGFDKPLVVVRTLGKCRKVQRWCMIAKCKFCQCSNGRFHCCMLTMLNIVQENMHSEPSRNILQTKDHLTCYRHVLQQFKWLDGPTKFGCFQVTYTYYDS